MVGCLAAAALGPGTPVSLAVGRASDAAGVRAGAECCAPRACPPPPCDAQARRGQQRLGGAGDAQRELLGDDCPEVGMGRGVCVCLPAGCAPLIKGSASPH